MGVEEQSCLTGPVAHPAAIRSPINSTQPTTGPSDSTTPTTLLPRQPLTTLYRGRHPSFRENGRKQGRSLAVSLDCAKT